jgi:hypothetical protein
VNFQVRCLDSAVVTVPLQERVLLILGYKSRSSMVISQSLLVPSSFKSCVFLVLGYFGVVPWIERLGRSDNSYVQHSMQVRMLLMGLGIWSLKDIYKLLLNVQLSNCFLVVLQPFSHCRNFLSGHGNCTVYCCMPLSSWREQNHLAHFGCLSTV